MKATVKIEKISSNGSRLVIEATCDTVSEVEEVTRVCKGYAPRQKLFGFI